MKYKLKKFLFQLNISNNSLRLKVERTISSCWFKIHFTNLKQVPRRLMLRCFDTISLKRFGVYKEETA